MDRQSKRQPEEKCTPRTNAKQYKADPANREVWAGSQVAGQNAVRFEVWRDQESRPDRNPIRERRNKERMKKNLIRLDGYD